MRSISVLGLVVLGVLTGSEAGAQSLYGRYVSFGDSLSDPGNLYALTAGGKPPAPYYLGHFSNGKTWIELIAPPTNTFFTAGTTGNVNYAFGGARTDALGGLNNLQQVPGSSFGVANPLVNAPPGIPVQIGSYLNRGGTVGGSTLVTLWGGANNFFNLFDTSTAGGNNPANNPTLPGFVLPSQTSIVATANSAVGDMATSIGSLYAAGSRNILILNLPDLGAAPSFNGSAATQQAGSGATLAYNSALASALGTVKSTRSDLNLIQVDVASTFNAIVANPAAFGFSNVTQACISTLACVTGSTATQNTYLFWDSVHPTAAGHQVLASLVDQYLNAPITAAQVAPLGAVALQERLSTASAMFDVLDPIGGKGEGAFVTGGYLGGQARGTSAGGRYDWQTASGTTGIIHPLADDWTGVAAFTLDTGRIGMALTSAKLVNGTVDVAAIYRHGMAFAKIGAGLGGSMVSGMKRATLGPLTNTASTSDIHGSLMGEVGAVYRVGALSIEPRLHAGLLAANLDGFSETGVVAPIAYEARQVSTLVGGGDLRIGAELGTGATPVTAYATLGYDRYFATSAPGIAGTLADNTASRFVAAAPGLTSPGVSVGLGLSTRLSAASRIDVDYRGTFGEASTNVQRAHAQWTVQF